MGLDTTHDAWHGAYSSFSRWRDKLCEIAGYELYDRTGYPGGKMTLIDWGLWKEENFYDPPYIPCRLDGTPDPLLLLICHSDCEGKIRSEFLDPLAKRLEELLPELEKQPDDGGHIGNWSSKTRQFILGCRAAASKGEDLEFH